MTPGHVEQPNLLLVLGMHRSGTSATTRWLNLLGADLGGRLLAAQAGVNEKGFWELQEMIEFNEMILRRLGRGWWDFSALPQRWWESETSQDLAPAAADLLRRNLAEGALYAVKEPRLCLLAPFWIEVIRSLGWRPCGVLVLRHPSEVIRSLTRRDDFGARTASLLWTRYTLDAEFHSRGLPRSIIAYDELLTNWRGLVGRVTQETGVQFVEIDAAISRAIDGELDPSLRHYRPVAGPDALDGFALRAYDLLHPSNGPADWDALDQLRAEFDAAFQAAPFLGAAGAEANDQIVALARRLSAVGAELEYARSVVSERDVIIRGKNSELADSESRMRVLDERIKTCLVDLQAKETSLGQAQHSLDARNDRIHVLEDRVANLEGRFCRRLARHARRLMDKLGLRLRG